MSGSFFGVQVAFALPLDDPVRGQLADTVRQLRADPALPAQRAGWTRAAGLLGQAISFAVLGSWDLIRDGGGGEYEDWASGIEAMADWPAEDFGSGGSLLLVSQIFLAGTGSNADLRLGELCDLPEASWHRRDTYRKLFAAPPSLNFTNLLGSGLFLAPRPDQPGFTQEVLTGEGFEYLHRVAG